MNIHGAMRGFPRPVNGDFLGRPWKQMVPFVGKPIHQGKPRPGAKLTKVPQREERIPPRNFSSVAVALNFVLTVTAIWWKTGFGFGFHLGRIS
jgi:hypothetical protein